MSIPLLTASVLSVVLAVASDGAPPEPLAACPGDVAEPNDTVPTAYRIPCTTMFIVPAWPTCLDPSGDVDHYAVNVAAGEVLAAVQSGGDYFDGLFSIYAPDGVTLLDQHRFSVPWESPVSTVVGPAGTYFISLSSPTGGTGQAPVAVRCRPFTSQPPPVGNTLLAYKSGGDVRLAWQRSRHIDLDPPTSYDVWRALPATNLYYDPLGPTMATSFDAGPIASPSGLILYRVRAVNPVGPDGPAPAVVRFHVLPGAPQRLDPSLPASVDPCDLPNLHPQLPFVVTVSLADRFGVPLDGYRIDLEANNTPQLPIGTFCTPARDPYQVTGTTGDAGPGRFEATFSFSDWDLTRNPSHNSRFSARSLDFGTADYRARVFWP